MAEQQGAEHDHQQDVDSQPPCHGAEREGPGQAGVDLVSAAERIPQRRHHERDQRHEEPDDGEGLRCVEHPDGVGIHPPDISVLEAVGRRATDEDVLGEVEDEGEGHSPQRRAGEPRPSPRGFRPAPRREPAQQERRRDHVERRERQRVDPDEVRDHRVRPRALARPGRLDVAPPARHDAVGTVLRRPRMEQVDDVLRAVARLAAPVHAAQHAVHLVQRDTRENDREHDRRRRGHAQDPPALLPDGRGLDTRGELLELHLALEEPAARASLRNRAEKHNHPRRATRRRRRTEKEGFEPSRQVFTHLTP